jgi:NADPH2:quinone reductase
VTSCGINFADTHARENSYLARYELPFVPGAEIAGVVERDGAGLEAGQRVVALVGTGGYAEYVAAPAATTFPIPDDVSDATALALLLQGLTAWHLYRTCARIAPGESVVVHAAAGGVGSLAVQLGRPFGAGRVIATASSEEKRALALELGADAAVDVGTEDLKAALIEANLGERVDVVLEMAGGRVFEASLDALAPFGRLVTYGIASREQNTVATGALMRKSRSVVGFWLMHCLQRPAELVDAPLQELFDRAAAGEIRVVEGETYALSDVRRAHEDLQARRTAGKLILDPTR